MNWNKEVKNGTRFKFGENWNNYLSNLNEYQINKARDELFKWLGDLNGKTFLDIGSGSGLHSLVARQLGATVFSFDFDKKSVECTKYLKEKYFPNDKDWTIEEGSILDKQYIESLGQFDIVYSWGVLHHTGSMNDALLNSQIPCKKGSKIFIAIYNTQPYWTTYWTFVKRTYNKNDVIKFLWTYFYISFYTVKGFIKDVILLKNPLNRYQEYKKSRGMSIYFDLIDWIGGYPFETAKPEEIFEIYKKNNFILDKIQTNGGGLGCNQYVFTKSDFNYE